MTILPSLFVHHGQQLRTVTIDGDPWFVAADVAAFLGHRMASDLTRALDPDERDTRPVRTPSGDQRMTVITEAGLYRAIMLRQTGRMIDDQARAFVKQFQRWVTHDVLPQLRRTGSYAVQVPQSLPEALRAYAAEVEAREAAEQRALELAPSAAAWDRLATADGDWSVSQAARILNRDPQIATGERRLFGTLRELGWTYRRAGAWAGYQTAIDTGRLSHREQHHTHPKTGAVVLDPPQVRVTAKGLRELHRHLGGSAPLALDQPPTPQPALI